MNNFALAIKRFLANKNTITVIGILASVAILYFGYKIRVDRAIEPIRFPIAKETIQPRTKITADMIEYVDIPRVRLTGKVIKNTEDIVDHYSNVNTIIPEGSLFYREAVIPFSELPDASLINIPEGLVPYNFPVDIEKSYGNSIFPNNYINIYFKGYNNARQLMVGKLVENIKVLAVKDRNGKHVFENTEENRISATIIFAVPENIHLLLRKASYMKDYEVELIPVPLGGVYQTEPGAIEMSSTVIETFILEHAPDIAD